MLVARSYSHAAPNSPTRRNSTDGPKSSKGMNEKHSKIEQQARSWNSLFTKRHSLSSAETLSKGKRGCERSSQSSNDHSQQRRPPSSAKPIPKPKPSHPVDVPSRPSSSDGKSRPPSTSGAPKRPQSSVKGGHDPKALTPAAAAMLAMTSIPKRRAFPRSTPTKSYQRKMSMDELVAEWKNMEREDSGLASSPKMETLLSAPDEEENEEALFQGSPGKDSPHSASFTSRSTSTDSVPSLIGESFGASSISSAYSPGRSRNNDDRIKPSPRSVELGDHPLLAIASDDDSEEMDFEHLQAPSTRRPQRKSSDRELPTKYQPSVHRQSSSFKSNLTASLTALRSAARSFSNFTAPAILPDDHLYRGLITQPYRPEMRPRPIEGTPTPQMRRYFNPTHMLAPGDFHLHNTHLDHADLESLAAKAALDSYSSGNIENPSDMHVIALQPFTKSGRPSLTTATNVPKHRRKSSMNVSKLPSKKSLSTSTEAGRVLLASPEPPLDPDQANLKPRREPRDNCDFLRLYVLEMSMRRSGKMEGPIDVSGRRGWCLPPREVVDVGPSAPREDDAAKKGKDIPRRWIGQSYN